MGIVAFSPLAQGVLTGKYLGGKVPQGSRGADPRTASMVQRYLDGSDGKVDWLAGVARQADLSLAQLAIRWVLRLPEVSSALIGASNLEQLEENLEAADGDLPQDLRKKIQSEFGLPLA
jgi:aryl-alcohol dehydrogenase-like predicted oxidoreductase